jgi:hypothetical protein
MFRSKMKIDDLLVHDGTILDNVLADTEILELLDGIGYDQVAIEAGKALQQNAMDLHLKQKAEYGEQTGATQELYEKWDEAKETYNRHLKIAKVLFRNNEEAKRSLILTGARKVSLTGWLVQALAFYNNAIANADFQTELAKRKITLEKLQAGLALVQGVEAAKTTQESEKAEAQDATAVRNAAIDELNDWMTDFLEFAKIALDGRPQLQEKLGIKK